MDGPGTITWDEFLENAERFVEMSNQISDGWKLRGDKVLVIFDFVLDTRAQNKIQMPIE